MGSETWVASLGWRHAGGITGDNATRATSHGRRHIGGATTWVACHLVASLEVDGPGKLGGVPLVGEDGVTSLALDAAA